MGGGGLLPVTMIKTSQCKLSEPHSACCCPMRHEISEWTFVGGHLPPRTRPSAEPVCPGPTGDFTGGLAILNKRRLVRARYKLLSGSGAGRMDFS